MLGFILFILKLFVIWILLLLILSGVLFKIFWIFFKVFIVFVLLVLVKMNMNFLLFYCVRIFCFCRWELNIFEIWWRILLFCLWFKVLLIFLKWLIFVMVIENLCLFFSIFVYLCFRYCCVFCWFNNWVKWLCLVWCLNCLFK